VPEPKYYNIHANHEWGEFFVLERDPIAQPDGHTRYSATWVANTSYGVFGHYWSHMGEPFAKFAATIGEDYLLGKISKMEPNAEVTLDSVGREILRARHDRRCTEDEARDAWDALQHIADECDDNSVFSKLYEDEDIHAVLDGDWDMPTTAYPMDAVQFVKKLWPEFAKALNAKEATNKAAEQQAEPSPGTGPATGSTAVKVAAQEGPAGLVHQ